MISIELDQKSMQAAMNAMQIAPKAVKAAVNDAIGRTITRVKKLSAQETSKRYKINSGTVKSILKTRRSNMFGEVSASGRPLPLGKFQKGIATKSGRRAWKRGAKGRFAKGSVRPLRLGLLKSGAKKPVPGLWRTASGYLEMRRGKELTIPAGPSIPSMLGSRYVVDKIIPEATKLMNNRFRQQLERRMGGK